MWNRKSLYLLTVILTSLVLSCGSPAPTPTGTATPIPDSDGDGLSDTEEKELGTNPSRETPMWMASLTPRR